MEYKVELTNGETLFLSEEDAEKIFDAVQKQHDIENVIRLGIKNLEFEEEIPILGEETSKLIAEKAAEDYRNFLDNRDEISEIMQEEAKDAVRMHLEGNLPVIGSYCISNNGSINLHYFTTERFYCSLNNKSPMWCDLYEMDYGDGDIRYGFDYGGVEVPVHEIMCV